MDVAAELYTDAGQESRPYVLQFMLQIPGI